MRVGLRVASALIVSLGLWTGTVMAQAKPDCDAQGKVRTPEKVEGQVVKVDMAQGKFTLRGADGQTHEFQASQETLQGLKVGDRMEAKLREAPKCP